MLDERSTRRWRKRSGAVAGRCLFAFGLAVTLLAGCGPPLLGERAYDRAKLIENMTDYREPEQVVAARELIEADVLAGAITAEERAALLYPLELAQEDRWDAAAEAARALLVAQQRR